MTAISDPTVNDDVSEGYLVGSIWLNTTTDTFFSCADNAEGAAVWSSSTGSPESSYKGAWNASTNTPSRARDWMCPKT